MVFPQKCLAPGPASTAPHAEPPGSPSLLLLGATPESTTPGMDKNSAEQSNQQWIFFSDSGFGFQKLGVAMVLDVDPPF